MKYKAGELLITGQGSYLFVEVAQDGEYVMYNITNPDHLFKFNIEYFDKTFTKTRKSTDVLV